MPTFYYFNIHFAILVHNKIIELSGGRKGMQDIGLLESVVEHVKNDDYYQSFEEKLTHLVFSIAMNHAFSDGNKRSAIALGAYFLQINGYSGMVGKYIIEMENIVLWVAKGYINKEFLSSIVNSLMREGNISEEIKLKIYEILDDEEKKKFKK
jgi:death on curing protein